MYYSVAAFEEAGLTENDVPKTWDELLEVGKKLTNDKRYGVLFETSPGYYQNFTWYPFMWQGGGEFQSADGKSAFNSPGVIQALKFWQDAVNQGVAPRKPLGGGGWDVGAESRLRLLRHAERRHLGDRAAARGRARLQVRHLQAADTRRAASTSPSAAAGRSSPTPRARTRRRRRVLRLGARLDERRLDPAGGRLVHQGEERHAAAAIGARAGQARLQRRLPEGLHRTRSIPAPAPSRGCRRRSTRSSPTPSRRAS